MANETLIALLKKLEADESIPYTRFLTDGDEDDYPAALKEVIAYCNANFVGATDTPSLEAAGYSIITGDCYCICTKKGTINTGSDVY